MRLFTSIRNIAVFVLLSLVLYGCPYSSEIALESNSKTILDEGLIGHWECEDFKALSLFLYVTKHNEETYQVIARQSGEDEYISDTLYAKPTVIKDESILSVKKGDVYTFFKYDLSGDDIKVWYAQDNYFEKRYAQSDLLKDAFVKHMNKKGFWSSSLSFEKIP